MAWRIEHEDERIGCYRSIGDWFITTEVSNFDDSTTVAMIVRANETKLRDGRSITPPLFYIRCMESITSIYIYSSNKHLVSGSVDYRVDDRPAGIWSMNESTDNEGLGFWGKSRAIPAAKELFGGALLRIRFWPDNESAVEVTFNITGLEEQIVPLREACNW